jgi:hypothetical protein
VAQTDAGSLRMFFISLLRVGNLMDLSFPPFSQLHSPMMKTSLSMSVWIIVAFWEICSSSEQKMIG